MGKEEMEAGPVGVTWEWRQIVQYLIGKVGYEILLVKENSNVFVYASENIFVQYNWIQSLFFYLIHLFHYFIPEVCLPSH